jgi:hypothetical protein
MHRPLYPGYPLDRRLGESQSRSGRYREEKNLTPTGNRIPVDQPVVHQKAVECRRKLHTQISGKPEEKKPLERRGGAWGIILKCILNKRVVRVYTGLIWFRIQATSMFL